MTTLNDIEFDEAALMNASKEDLVRLAQQLALAKLAAAKIGPQTDDELHAFIKEKWGISIPRVAVTPGMDAPFSMVADVFFFRETSVIGVANREGSKCVTGDTLIYNPDTGLRQRIDRAVLSDEVLPVLSADENGEVKRAETAAHWSNGKKQCLRLKTLSGRSVTVTPEHPMLTPEGFVRADELEVGSDVASVSYLPEPKKAQRIPDHHVDLLAVLLAEGGISGSNLKFSTTDPEILDIMVRACDLERCDVKPISGPDYRISKRIGVGTRSPIAQLLDHYGVPRTLAKVKRLPDAIFSLPDIQLQRFLAVFWMCDGYVTEKEYAVTLASEGLIEDLQHVLLRVHAQSRVSHHKAWTSDGKCFDAYKLAVYGGQPTSNFWAVGSALWGHKLDAARKLNSKKRLGKSGRPRITAQLKSRIGSSDRDPRLLWDRLGWSYKNVPRPGAGASVLTKGAVKTVSPQRLRALCEHNGIHEQEFALYLSQDLWWDPVVEIEDAGESNVYDLTVNGTENFVANDLVCHNTTNVAIIHALLAHFYPGYEGISAGAIGEQTKRVYNALKKLNRTWGQEKIKESQATHIEWHNGSVVEPKDGTDAQMNGPHCHPPDELVLTSEGYVKIADLVPGKHMLASYTKTNDLLTWGKLHGKINKGQTSKHIGVHQHRDGKWIAQVQDNGQRVSLGKFDLEDQAGNAVAAWRAANPKTAHAFDVTKWDFDGNLVVASTASGRSRMTPRHKVRVKLTEDFYSSWVVYLMRRGNWWRIGMTSANRLHKRLNEEGGDAIWLLGVHDNKLDAVTEEIQLQARHGITGICFTAGSHANARINDPGAIHESLSDVSFPRAIALLKEKGMSSDLPLFGRYGFSSSVAKSERFSYSRGRWFVTAVANLTSVSGMFYMPAATDTFVRGMVKDHPNPEVANISLEPYAGDVYSIDIKPHHYYVANGLVVHNSNLLHRDEVEQFRRSAFNEADNITKSGMTTDGRRIPAIDILTTSRKKARGLLQELLDRVETAQKEGTIPPYKVYTWGVAETIENQPNCQKAPENLGKPECDLCNCHKYVNGKMPDGSPRSLAKVCAGRFYRSDGWRPREPDIAGKFMANSAAMWDAQQECNKPATEGLILGEFSKETHGIKGWVPDPENGKIYQSADLGGTNAHSAHWYQYLERMVSVVDYSGNWKILLPDTYVVFGEVYISEAGNNAFAKRIKAQEAEWKSKYPFFEVEERYADIAAKAVRLDFKQNHDLPTVWRITREVNVHIEIIQDLVANDRIYVDIDSAPMWAEEAEAWQWDGDTGKQLDTFNHAMSDARYAIANIERKLIGEKKHPHNREQADPIAGPVVGAEPTVRTMADPPSTGPVTKRYITGSPHDDMEGMLPIHQGSSPASLTSRMLGP